jgi:two-component system, NarL family, sensor kinase
MKTQVSSYEEELLRVQLEIQEDMFRTLSLQIHDNVGQQLSLSKLYLHSMEKCLHADVKEQVENVRQLITDCIHDLRELAGIFSYEAVQQIGLVETLRKQVSIIRRTGHLQVHLDIGQNLPEPDHNTSVVLFRMIQECLFNVLSNALATRMEIKIWVARDMWFAEVSDNRKEEFQEYGGVPPTLAKKAKLIGAGLFSQYQPGQGLCYKICLPLNKHVP